MGRDWRTLVAAIGGGGFLLGILSNGVWDLVAKPLLFSGTKLVLDIATFGLTTLQNNIYRDIAFGQYDRNAQILSMITFAILCAMMVMATFSHALPIFAKEPHHPLTRKGYIGTPGGSQTERPFRRRFCAFCALVTVSAIVMLVVVFTRQSYITSAVNNLAQLLAIDGPYLSEGQRLVVASRIAQVSNRSDYVAIDRELREIAARYGIQPPAFSAY